MFSLRNAFKSYKAGSSEKIILRDVSLDIPLDKNIGILGQNGAGKSTLIRILSGIEKLDRGSVTLASRVSFPLGFGGGIHPSMTGEENCRFVARIYGQEIEGIVDFAKDFAELGAYFYLPVRTYSSGMRARLAFGLSLALEFDVYLIDEVIAVGDRRFQRKSRDAFRRRRARSTIIMVSHSVGTIRQYCQRGAILHDGKIEVFDRVDEAQACYESLS